MFKQTFNLYALNLVSATFILLGAFSSCMGDNFTVMSEIHDNLNTIKSISINGGFLEVRNVGDSTVEAVTLN